MTSTSTVTVTMAVTATATVTAAKVQLLYDDVLHSIFACLEVNDLTRKYHEMNSAARTCQRWFNAAMNMKYHESHCFTFYDDHQDDFDDTPAPAHVSSPLDEEKVDPFYDVKPSTTSHVTSIVASRLRRMVASLRYKEESLTFDDLLLHWRQNNFVARMSHLHTLALRIRISTRHESATISELASSSNDTETLSSLFPPSLRTLCIQLIVGHDFTGRDEIDEATASSHTKWIYDTIGTTTEVIASHVTRSCSHSLNRLQLEFCYSDHGIRSTNLPASALLPWSNRLATSTTALPMLRHLTLFRPTLQCMDQVRPMLDQLHRVDGRESHQLLQRLLKKEAAAAEIHASSIVTNKLPFQLRTYSGCDLSLVEYQMLTRYFTQLRHLHLDTTATSAAYQIGSAFAELPHLISFALWNNFPEKLSSSSSSSQSKNHEKNLIPSAGVTLITSLSKYVPQLEYIKLDQCQLTNSSLIDFLPQMIHLREFALRRCGLITLSCFSHAPPSLVRVDLHYLPIASRNELDHLKHIPRVSLKDCDHRWRSSSSQPLPVFLSSEQLYVSQTPLAARLVGIELNPGPTAIDRLYVDVLHSIYSFIDTQNYREFTSPARTCKSWFEAAVTMKFPVPPSINYDTTEPPLRSESLVARSQRQITAICTSRLRQVVTSMRLLPVTSTAGLLDELKKVSVLMPHLRKLHITVQISNKHSKLQFDSTDHHHHHHHHHQQPLLPSLLKSLVIDVISLESYSQQSLLDEKMTPSRSVLSDHIIELMDQLSFFARTSCPHLVELELMYKEPIYLQYLPAALLATWNRVSSLRHLRVKSPSLQCADVMRTMNQLRCIDGITTHEILKQLVKGTPKLTLVQQSTEAAAAAVDPSLPLLRSYRMSEDEHYIDLSLLAHFPHLTSLRLNNCDSDPGPILFVHLPQLKRLTWYEQALHPHTMRTELISIDDVLTSIRIYAPQLEYLQLAHPHLSQSNPQYQELLRSISNMKHLNKQNSAPTPIATHHLSRL